MHPAGSGRVAHQERMPGGGVVTTYAHAFAGRNGTVTYFAGSPYPRRESAVHTPPDPVAAEPVTTDPVEALFEEARAATPVGAGVGLTRPRR
jgi:hypothetical protein